MDNYDIYYPNRTLCAVLDEMRVCYKTRNFCGLNGLIEEAQTLGNRMEAHLFDNADGKKLVYKISDLKEQKQLLEDEIRVLEKTKNAIRKS